MGWNFDQFDLEPYEPEPEKRKLTGLLIGVLVGAVSLLLIAALVFTTVSYVFLDDDEGGSILRRSENNNRNAVNADLRTSSFSFDGAAQVVTPTAIAPNVVADADAEYLLLTNVYERVSPSVVNIEVASRMIQSDIIDSSGSGFVLDGQGHIVTNAHVVRNANDILVTFFDGYVAEAEVVGLDDYSDLAVIRVPTDGPQLVPVILGDSNDLGVGQRVIAIDNPFGLDNSMTVGIVSGLGRSLPSAQLLDPTYDDYNNPSIIQIDAAVNPGNSGGPLLDSYGRVIGINTAIRTENGGFQGIAFAVPVNTMNRIVPQLIEDGEADYSWLGISALGSEGGLSTAALAEELDLPVRTGVMITEVFAESPAEIAGLRGGNQEVRVRGITILAGGDIIVAINGMLIRDIDELVAYLVENTSPGDTVVLTIVRDGQTFDVDVGLGSRPR
ncbi:MAG: PDZ domain-containing protein [Chloroflexi bacterium]|nr:PDZ domain-containing protein [Chloroflexota bacterium]